MLPSEVTDIDQPLYDWGIENRMEQYYNTAPPQAHFAAMEEPAHQVIRSYILSTMKKSLLNIHTRSQLITYALKHSYL